MPTITGRRSSRMLFTVILVLSAGCRNHEAGQPPDHPRLTPNLTLEDVTFRSSALNRDMQYRVVLPLKVAPRRKLQVVYLLHGGGLSGERPVPIIRQHPKEPRRDLSLHCERRRLHHHSVTRAECRRDVVATIPVLFTPNADEVLLNDLFPSRKPVATTHTIRFSCPVERQLDMRKQFTVNTHRWLLGQQRDTMQNDLKRRDAA